MDSVNSLRSMGRPRGGMEQQLNAMSGTGTVYQIVNTFANSVSLAPWCLYRKPGPRAAADAPRQIVGNHAALNLWNRPNAFFTRQELIESVQQHIELVGEGYLLVSRHPRSTIPMELWPIQPYRMMPVPHPTDFLSGWIYLGPNGERIPLELNEVIQIRVPNPIDPYRGLGAAQTIIADAESVKLSAEWNRNFFLNGAQPGGIIEVQDSLDDEEYNRLQRQWNDDHRGVPNAHRVAILERAKWVDRSVSHDDMQFVQLRNVSRDSIREAFGMSKVMLGVNEDVNRATAEASAMIFRRDKRVPRLERWKQALNNDLLPMFFAKPEQVDVMFDFEAQIPEDEVAEAAERKSKTEGAKALREAGWHPDDVLAAMDLPPMRYVGPARTTGAPTTTPPDDMMEEE